MAAGYAGLAGGRTRFAGVDQGIDFTGPGPVYSLDEGIITRLLRKLSGWPGEGALLVERFTAGPAKGRYQYVAEDFQPAPNLRVGSRVRKGQVLGQATGSGRAPGIEVGWANAAGRPIAPLPPKGQPTSAGTSFRTFAGRSSAPVSTSLFAYDFDQLRRLWIQAGGPPRVAETMAAVALAESGGNPGNPDHVNKDGTHDRGLWQINSSHAGLFTAALYNPLANARAAVSVYKSQGLGAWSTFTSGAYQAYMPGGQLNPGGRTRPDVPGDSQHGGGGGGVAGFLGDAFHFGESAGESVWKHTLGGGIGSTLDVFRAAVWLLSPRSWLRMVEFAVGMLLLLMGLVGLAVVFLSRNPLVQGTATALEELPGPVGATSKVVTATGSSSGRRRVARHLAENTAPVQRARSRQAYEERESRLQGQRDRARQQEQARTERTTARKKVRAEEHTRRMRERDPDYDKVPF